MSEQQADYKTRSRTIFRVEKNADNPFVMIDRRPIENPKLSWKAKGILAYLLSRPDNWIVRLGDLVKRSPDGAFAVRAAIKELREAGHITYQIDRENGHIKQWLLVVHEIPLLRGNQQVGNQQVENLALNNTDSLTETDSKDIKEGASAKPKTPKAKVKKEPTPQPPEILIFREVVKHFPKPFQRDIVIEAVQKVSARLGRDVTVEDLCPYFKAWGKVSANEWSLVWLADWAVSGKAGNGNGKAQPQPAVDNFMAEYEAKKERARQLRAGRQTA